MVSVVLLIGVMLCRNEAWVLRYSARVALQWCDHLIVLDHASTDATPDVLTEVAAEHHGRVTTFREPNPTMQWMRQRERLLGCARKWGATHVALVDADEVLSANLVPVARGVVESLRPKEMLRPPWHNLWRSLDAYRCDASKHGKQSTYLAFADHQGLHWRVPEELHHRDPEGIAANRFWPSDRTDGGIMHLQRANWRRARARQDLYRMQEVTRWPGREPVSKIDERYQASLAEDGAVLLQVPPDWWAHGLDRSMIDLDAEPWEVAECGRMLAEHGRGRFAGLSLSC